MFSPQYQNVFSKQNINEKISCLRDIFSCCDKTSPNRAGVAEPRLKIWDKNLGQKFGTTFGDRRTDGRTDRKTDRQTDKVVYRLPLQLIKLTLFRQIMSKKSIGFRISKTNNYFFFFLELSLLLSEKPRQEAAEEEKTVDNRVKKEQ